MGKHPKLDRLEDLFKSNDKFRLSDAEYENLVGIRLPKDSNYLLKRSALARKCEEEGFIITLQEKIVTFEKITRRSGES